MAHKSLILLAYSPSQTIAKVGVEGSNPFARSNRTKEIKALRDRPDPASGLSLFGGHMADTRGRKSG